MVKKIFFSFVLSQSTRLTDEQTDILLVAKTVVHRSSAVTKSF